MPLSAYYLGSRLESWSISAEQWAQLKGEYRGAGLTMTCGQAGVPKTSSRGMQFFAHKPGSACLLHEGGPESAEHLATKAAVAEAARALGWEAILEYPAKDRTWIADVFLSKGLRTLIVEAQWSPQTKADFERRQARYAAAGIECVWLVADVNVLNATTVPHYVVEGTVGALTIRLPTLKGGITVELQAGVKRLLRGDIRPRVELRATAVAVLTQMSKCWHCEKWITLWAVTDLQLLSRCGSVLTLEWSDPWPRWVPRRREQPLIDLVRSAIAASDLPPSITLARRYSNQAERHYVAMICPRCNYVQGDGLLEWRRSATSYRVPFPTMLAMPFSERIRAQTHVCEDTGNGLCSSTLIPAHPSVQFPPDDAHLRITGADIDLPPLPSRRSGRHRPVARA